MRTHAHTQITKTAIGYVPVSTEEQATDGVSLDVQRDKLRAYCRLNGIAHRHKRLTKGSRQHVRAAGFASGATDAAAGASEHADRRQARQVVAVAARCLHPGRRAIFPTSGITCCRCAGWSTPTGGGAHGADEPSPTTNQFEREMISERTRDALQHMKAQGDSPRSGAVWVSLPVTTPTRMGGACPGAAGREQTVLRRIRDMRSDGMKLPRSRGG